MGWEISDIVLSKPMRGLNPVLSFRHAPHFKSQDSLEQCVS